MGTTVTTVQPAQARSDVQPVTTDEALAELAHLRALDDAVARLTAAQRAAHPVVTSREMERGGIAATGQRVADLGRRIVSRSELRRLELQVQFISDQGEGFRAARGAGQGR